MNISEFKAWLDGFCVAIGDKAPSKAQWEEIRDKIASIDAEAKAQLYKPVYRSGDLPPAPRTGDMARGNMLLSSSNTKEQKILSEFDDDPALA